MFVMTDRLAINKHWKWWNILAWRVMRGFVTVSALFRTWRAILRRLRLCVLMLNWDHLCTSLSCLYVQLRNLILLFFLREIFLKKCCLKKGFPFIRIQDESLTCAYILIVDSRGRKNHFFLIIFSNSASLTKYKLLKIHEKFQFWVISRKRFYQIYRISWNSFLSM